MIASFSGPSSQSPTRALLPAPGVCCDEPTTRRIGLPKGTTVCARKRRRVNGNASDQITPSQATVWSHVAETTERSRASSRFSIRSSVVARAAISGRTSSRRARRVGQRLRQNAVAAPQRDSDSPFGKRVGGLLDSRMGRQTNESRAMIRLPFIRLAGRPPRSDSPVEGGQENAARTCLRPKSSCPKSSCPDSGCLTSRR